MPLHVTNGDSAANGIRQAGFGPILVWKDVLHEGPVPDTPDLNPIRARFLSDCNWGDYNTILAEMNQRDTTLRAADSVVLWFEHDLYDQLQLIQIMSMIQCPAEIICTNRYLGPMKAKELRDLWPSRDFVHPEQIALAKRAWAAFTSSDPASVRKLVKEDLTALPFLTAALFRLLEEYPGSNGLSRTDRQILQVASIMPDSFADLFQLTQAMETAQFMGDSVLRMHLTQLRTCKVPLIRSDRIDVTMEGIQVIDGTMNHIDLNGIDRWIGGVHLK